MARKVPPNEMKNTRIFKRVVRTSKQDPAFILWQFCKASEKLALRDMKIKINSPNVNMMCTWHCTHDEAWFINLHAETAGNGILELEDE